MDTIHRLLLEKRRFSGKLKCSVKNIWGRRSETQGGGGVVKMTPSHGQEGSSITGGEVRTLTEYIGC